MFTTKKITKDSFPIAVIKDAKRGKVQQTIFFTEPTRELKNQIKSGEKKIDLIDLDENDEYILDDSEQVFEMVPTITTSTTTSPRFINFYLSASNSGKSYQIASLCRRYLQMFPDNMIAYASANPLDNDSNYKDIRDKIKEIDVLNLQSQIDFSKEEYRNSLWIFDDCDSSFSANMSDLDKRLNKEEIDKMTVTDKQKVLRMLKNKQEIASEFVKKSIVSFMQNGRKMHQSLCVVSHKPMGGSFENNIINEANGVILFPASMNPDALKKFMMTKLSFSKEAVEYILYDIEWIRYDWLYISHRTSVRFIITQNRIKLYPWKK